MVYASKLAERMGRVDNELTQRQVNLLTALHLPVALPSPANLTIESVLDRMRLDKKTIGGKLRFVLPTRMGHVELVSNVDESLVREVLRDGGLS